MKKLLRTVYHLSRSILSRIKLSKHPQGSLVILTYHRILPDGHSDLSLEQPGVIASPECLDMNLTALKKIAIPITVDDWLKGKKNNTLQEQLYFSITFDDGWQDNYQFAFPVLKKHNMASTIFVVTKMINTDLGFWPGKLAKLIKDINQYSPGLMNDQKFITLVGSKLTIPYSIDQIDQAICCAKRYKDEEINTMIEQFYLEHKELSHDEKNRTLLNHNEVSSLINSNIITLGSHTQTHCRLHQDLSKEIMNKEIVESKNDLSKLTNKPSSIFCYPNGDLSDPAQALVKDNYNGACTTEKGVNHPSGDSFQLKRFNLHNGNANSPQRLLSTLLC